MYKVVVGRDKGDKGGVLNQQGHIYLLGAKQQNCKLHYLYLIRHLPFQYYKRKALCTTTASDYISYSLPNHYTSGLHLRLFGSQNRP